MIAPLALLAAVAPQEPAPLVRFEPGVAWTYEGEAAATATGRIIVDKAFPVRARYVAIPGAEPGGVTALLWLDFGAGHSRFMDKSREIEPVQWGTFLSLAADLTLESSLAPRRYEHPMAIELELSPFPPPATPRTPGTAVSQVRTVNVGRYDYETQWDWTVERLDDGLRLELVPHELPVDSVRFGAAQQLVEFEQRYEVDDGGRLRLFELRHRQVDRHSGESEEAELAKSLRLRLVDAAAVGDAELAAMTEQFAAVRDQLLAYRPQRHDDGERAVTALLARLEGSPLYPIGRDLLWPMLRLRQRVTEKQVWNGDKAGSLDGAAAPALAGADLDGDQVTLADLRQKVVLLNFWASW